MARFRSIRAEDIAEAVRGFVRAGRPRSQEGFIPGFRQPKGRQSAEAFWRRLLLVRVSAQGTLLNNRNSGTADLSYSSNSTTSPTGYNTEEAFCRHLVFKFARQRRRALLGKTEFSKGCTSAI